MEIELDALNAQAQKEYLRFIIGMVAGWFPSLE